MKKQDKIVIIVLLMAFLALSLIITINLTSITSFSQKYLGVYGYPAVFVLSFLSDTTDQPIGPDTIGGFAVLLGMNLFLVIMSEK